MTDQQQAQAALAYAIDIAKTAGLTHEQCHEVVDSRPHVMSLAGIPVRIDPTLKPGEWRIES